MKPRAHITVTAWLGPWHFGGAPGLGWKFRTGGSADPGCFLVESDDEGRFWLTRFWTAGDASDKDRWGLMVGVRVHVPEAAVEALGNAARWRRL